MSARVYGNWRRPRSAGMWGFGTLPLGILMGGSALAAFVSQQRGLLVGAAVMAMVLIVVLPMRFLDRYGRNLWQRVAWRVAWHLGRARGQDLYHSGPLARIGHGTHSLPGLASGIEALEAFDGLHRPFALLWHRAVNHVSVVIEVASDGAALLDDHEVDLRVAAWGDWLAGLGYQAGLVGASVTVEAAPDPGARLRREVESHVVPDSPPFAREVMTEIVQSYPQGSASITTRIALTWSMLGRGTRRTRSIEELAVDIGHRLPDLTATLAGTGAGPGRPMTVAELAAAIRVAYEPGAHEWVEAGGADEAAVVWAECGPRCQEEHSGWLSHDGSWSITWEMGKEPRGMVLSSVLAPLLRPHPKLARKRVTILYRLHDPATAAQVVERDYRDAVFTKSNSRGLHAGQRLAADQAERAAQEEAQGAGLTRFALVATATVTDRCDLDEAAAIVEDLGLGARMALRRAWGSQAGMFAAGLPLGIVVPAHLRIPEHIRELA